MRRTALFTTICLFSLLLISCSGFGSGSVDTSQEQFYTGTRGVDATFEHVPRQLFFYSDIPAHENEFEVSVEVRNRGASPVRGGVFLSGYDPNLIRFDEVPIRGWQGAGPGSCGISFSSLGRNDWAGVFSCADVSFGGSSVGDFRFFDINSMASLANSFGWDWDPAVFDIRASGSQLGDNRRVDVNFDFDQVNMDYWGRGRLTQMLFAGIDFTSVLGREYSLPGRSYEFPSGGVEYLTYRGEIQNSGWSPGLDELRQPLLLTNCYLYSTHAAPLVCVDPQPYSNERKICTAGHTSFSGSQGAPVAVTSVEQEAGPRGSSFRINIENRGRGEVFDPGQILKCSPYVTQRVRQSDKDVVYVVDVRIGNERLENCVPDGVVRLVNGRGTITCNYPYVFAGSNNAYETPLYVELAYGYKETQRQEVVIKRVS